MKQKPIAFIVLLIAGLLGMLACEDNTLLQGTLTERTTYLYLNYQNPDTSAANNDNGILKGDAPSIALDSAQSSRSIKIDFSKDFNGEIVQVNREDRAEIIIDNMRVVDEFGNFRIKDVITEEFKDGQWRRQSQAETPVIVEPMQKLDVVLVLDASGSMEGSMDKMKEAAIRFVNEIDERIVDARFGIVSFSDAIDSVKITENAGQVTQHINSLEARGLSTPLYRSMIDGIAMLEQSQAESKVLLTFTDGLDNTDGFSPNDVIERLNKQSDDFNRVQSYAIGLRGDSNLEEDIIEDISVRGFALFPENDQEMEEFFNYFSTVVATVYQLRYQRNNGAINNPLSIRFQLITEQQ